MQKRTSSADLGIALKLPVSVAVRVGVSQNLVVGADHAIVILVIDIFIAAKKSLFAHGALVGSGYVSAILLYFLAYPWGLVSGVHCNRFHFFKGCNNILINSIKHHTVMDVSGRDFTGQHKVVFITGHM